jgi:AbrB family looped-hinge helix DNA binding protein
LAKTAKRLRVQIGQAGRLVLPADVRRELGVEAGDDMVLTLDPEGAPGSVRLDTVAASIREAQRIVAEQALTTDVPPSEELIQDRRAAADDE